MVTWFSSRLDRLSIGTEAEVRDSVNRQIDWSVPRRCLLLGVAGSGMQALSAILHQSGHVLYGSDRICGTGREVGTDTDVRALLENVRLVPWGNSSPELSVDVVICSPAIPATAPLLRWSQDQSIRVMSLQTAVGSVFADRRQICVSGTHGKSTTSGLLAWILNNEASDAGVFLGAHWCACRQSRFGRQGGHYGRSDLAVIEACEFDRSFLQLQPHHVILNGIDSDHFDCFASDEAENAAYRQFLERVPSHGTVFFNAECQRSASVVAKSGVASVRWKLGKREATDWAGRIVRSVAGRMTVRIWHRARRFGDLQVPVFGRHNAANLLAAVAMASYLGISATECQRALVDFPGLTRRLEYRGEYRGTQMMDDYAHHPAAVTTTLLSVRQAFPDRRIRVIFEPHQMNRLLRRREQFIEALSLADEVMVLPVFPAREQVSVADCHRISRELAAMICELGTPAVFADGVQTAVSLVNFTGDPEDILLTMGAGTVYRIHDEVHRRFQRDSAA